MTFIRAFIWCLSVSVAACVSDQPQGLPARDFCQAMARAGCDWAEGCGEDIGSDCEAGLADIWDGCPPAISAVTLGEVRYDEEAAVEFVRMMRETPCGDWPSNDPRGALQGTLAAGAACHSDFSCREPLRCVDFSLSEPEGRCDEDPHAFTPPTPMPAAPCTPGALALCACPDGASGSSMCTAAGQSGPCMCQTPAR